jgi:hypothetical protein
MFSRLTARLSEDEAAGHRQEHQNVDGHRFGEDGQDAIPPRCQQIGLPGERADDAYLDAGVSGEP